MRKTLLAYLSLIPFASFAQIKEMLSLNGRIKKKCLLELKGYLISRNSFHYDADQKALFYTLK
jgi:hypothetical protein